MREELTFFTSANTPFMRFWHIAFHKTPFCGLKLHEKNIISFPFLYWGSFPRSRYIRMFGTDRPKAYRVWKLIRKSHLEAECVLLIV
jgi:hypothetical protein